MRFLLKVIQPGEPPVQPFFERQTTIVLQNSGKIDPEKIEEYIAEGGYVGLLRALNETNPAEIIQEISKSGLRGRGGAGYPTGLKWGTASKTAATTKYVICNADEGDPGAFMDRSVLESDPHRVIEGMTIAAFAVNASHGYIYVRAEYPLAVKRLGIAIRDARRLGFLGSQICNTKFSFDVGSRFKAVQTGGPSGGCIPEQLLDLPVDYESLKEVGSIMGSGGMIVMDDSACMVNVARYFMEFCMSESCGKCIPCRAGTAQTYDLLTRMTNGKAAPRDLELPEELCDMVSTTSLCGLGQSAPNPVVSTLRYFRDEYIEHIEQKRCRAGVCNCERSSLAEVSI